MTEALPFFSVVIPTHGRPSELRACLQALCAVDYPADRFEVIVVDDGSPTPVESVVALFRERLTVALVRQEKSGPAAARNTGVAKAKGTLLAFTDDDCLPDPGWLRELARRLAEAPDDMIGGRTINGLLDNLFSTATQELISYLYDYYASAYGQPRLFTSNNLAVHAGWLLEIGGFDAGFAFAGGEDRELCDRWVGGGRRMTYAPNAVVRHVHVLNFRGFWQQHFNYGRGALRFHRLRADRTSERIKIEPLRFYLDLLRYPFSRLPSRQALLVAPLIAVAQTANAAGFFWEKRRSPPGGRRNAAGGVAAD
jgi:glycosyltransferase involved in cell wall biosynthesis